MMSGILNPFHKYLNTNFLEWTLIYTYWTETTSIPACDKYTLQNLIKG